jgi:hypothetical protein
LEKNPNIMYASPKQGMKRCFKFFDYEQLKTDQS